MPGDGCLPPSAARCMVLGAGCLVLSALAATTLNAQTLSQRIDAATPKDGVAWIEYRVPMLDGPRRLCCFDSGTPRGGDCRGRCRLEDRDGAVLTGDSAPAAPRITVEPPGVMRVFARLENQSVTRVRLFSLDCDVDTSGTALTTLSDVSADDSVSWLATVVRATAGQQSRLNAVHMPALSALALHPGKGAVTTLIALARTDQRARIRSQAVFWLSQRAGDEAVRTIGQAIDDPEIEVKRRAVFALSQLPRGEGVPLLMNLARNHRLPEVRRQAMFWLGQSKDPRAVDFFEDILKN